MDTSMTVTGVEVKSITSFVLRCSDMNLDEWTVDFRAGSFYSDLMASQIVSDLKDGGQPYLTCGYDEDRDLHVVSDDHGNQVVLWRFSNWTRI